MKKSFCIVQALFVSSVALSHTVLAATPSAETLAYTCAGCHGANGNSTGPATPSIAGMGAEYFVESMQEFQADERPNTIMGRIARGYSEEEIKVMAEYFSAQSFSPAKQSSDAALAQNGLKLHDKYCEKCHADAGTDAEDESGYLSGQWGPYLQYALADFLAGDREMPKKMKKQVEKLIADHGEESSAALLEFYATGTTEVK